MAPSFPLGVRGMSHEDGMHHTAAGRVADGGALCRAGGGEITHGWIPNQSCLLVFLIRSLASLPVRAEANHPGLEAANNGENYLCYILD